MDFTATWAQSAGFRVHHCTQTVEAVEAAGESAAALGIPEGRPLLKSSEIYFADESTPAGLFISFYHPDHICISARFEWKAPQTSISRPIQHNQGATPCLNPKSDS
ncbi:MAG: UTRA domain-containing protein [Lentisphaerae bacterium]|nr:UTRA domain-containing protein [Lentisphaerota bacterium]